MKEYLLATTSIKKLNHERNAREKPQRPWFLSLNKNSIFILNLVIKKGAHYTIPPS